MRVLVIAEKPSFARAVSPALRAAFPDLIPEDFVVVYVNPYVHLGRLFDLPDAQVSADPVGFRYPRGLSWSDFPIVREPTYRTIDVCNGNEFLVPKIGLPGGRQKPVSSKDELQDAISQCTLVLAAMDPDASSVHAFDLALNAFYPDSSNRPLVTYPWFSDFYLAAIRKAIATAEPWEMTRSRYLPRSLIKRRFEFNYRLNAFAILGRAFENARPGDVHHDGRNVTASKNALQLLYSLRDAKAQSDGLLIDRMYRWKGTGRYHDPEPGTFGLSASRASIIEHLMHAGLVERHERLLRISTFANRFLDSLHPDCCDSDQCFRISEWMTMPTEKAYPKVDRYLRTFFGKQKRFLAG